MHWLLIRDRGEPRHLSLREHEKLIERIGHRLPDRILAKTKRRRGDRCGLTRTTTYARRFAAEAPAKALGTGFRLGVSLRDLAVVNLPSKQPGQLLTDGALRRLQAIMPPAW